MFDRALYHQINALIGNLEEKKEKLDRELLSDAECKTLAEQVEGAWLSLCRRNGLSAKRGPYARREN